MVSLSVTEIVIRLGTTTLLAALIGLEREWHEKPAGISHLDGTPAE